MNTSDTGTDRDGEATDREATDREATDREATDEERSDREESYDVVVVGGGVAGLSAGVFTARAGLSTRIIENEARGSILRRNAHLENVPGFPAGVNARLFLDMTREQAERAGCAFTEGVVTGIERTTEGFALAVDGDGSIGATRVIVASWSDSNHLDGLGVDLDERGSKRFVIGRNNDGPRAGRTAVEGLYVAGRLADQYHQTVVAAGNGAQVALTLIHDSEIPFYHDWVAPEGYFTDRDRDVPPGVEEISDEERRRRERESMAVMREYFTGPHPDDPTPHPSLADDPNEEDDPHG